MNLTPPTASPSSILHGLAQPLTAGPDPQAAALGSTPSPIPDDLPFEAALAQLERVVELMQKGQVPLESLVQYFQEGSHLLAHGQKRLKEAELKVMALRKETGNLEPFAIEEA